LAEAWSSGSGSRAEFEAALADIRATEEFHAYPGVQLLTALGDHAADFGHVANPIGLENRFATRDRQRMESA
jgi:arginine decarboxylase